jgi:hypothetical protein
MTTVWHVLLVALAYEGTDRAVTAVLSRLPKENLRLALGGVDISLLAMESRHSQPASFAGTGRLFGEEEEPSSVTAAATIP